MLGSSGADGLDMPADLPSNCGLAIALPLSESAFFADAEATSGKDFVPGWMKQHRGWAPQLVWQEYLPYAQLALDVAHEAEQLGVLIQLNSSFEQWCSLLRERNVVVLFAHNCSKPLQDSIEFADGPHSIERVVAGIPSGYAGVLDFTVCYSLALAPAIKVRNPECTVIMNKRAARLDYRLAIYRQALRLLATGGYSHVDALAEVQLAVLRHATLAQRPDLEVDHE